MAGALAEPAEVSRRGDQPPAEMPQPEAIDEHPGDERMAAPRQPARVREAPAARPCLGLRGSERLDPFARWPRQRQDRKLPRRNRLLRLLVVATVEELRFGDASLHFHRRHHEAFGRLRSPQRRPFRSLVVDLFFLRRVVEIEGVGGQCRWIRADQRLVFLRPLSLGRGPGRAVGIAHLFRELDDFRLEDLVEEGLPHGVGRSVDRGGLGLDRSRGGPFLRLVKRIEARSRGTPLLPVVDRVEDRAEPVVVGLRDRVVAMVVALGASDGEPEEGRRRHLDLFRDHLVAGEVLVGDGIAGAVGGETQKRRGDELIAAEGIVDGVAGRLLGRCGELVAGELLLDEAIPGKVVLKTLHHPVAVAPGMRPERIDLGEAVGVGIAGDIEPGPRLPLAVSGACEQPFHDLLVSVARSVGDEGSHLLRGWEEPGEIERDAAEERRPVGFRREREPFGAERREDEGIDRGAPGCRVGRRRHGWLDDRLERPPRPIAGRQIGPQRNRFRFRLDGTRAGGDPALDRGELVCRHLLPSLRHLPGTDHPQKFAGARIPRHEERPMAFRVTIEKPAEPQIDAPLHRIFFAVAVGAIGLQNRPDITFPGRAGVGASRSLRRWQRGQEHHGNEKRPAAVWHYRDPRKQRCPREHGLHGIIPGTIWTPFVGR